MHLDLKVCPCVHMGTVINILEWSSTAVLHTNPQFGVPEGTHKNLICNAKLTHSECVVALDAFMPTCGSCQSRPQYFCVCTPSSWWSPAGYRWCHHLDRHISVGLFPRLSHDSHSEFTAEKNKLTMFRANIIVASKEFAYNRCFANEHAIISVICSLKECYGSPTRIQLHDLDSCQFRCLFVACLGKKMYIIVKLIVTDINGLSWEWETNKFSFIILMHFVFHVQMPLSGPGVLQL